MGLDTGATWPTASEYLHVYIDRRDNNPRSGGDQIDAHQRDANPGIDDDALVQYSIEDVDKT